MKRGLPFVSLALCLIAGTAFSTPTFAQAVGAAQVDSIDGSGIAAEFLFLDTGSPENGLVVIGSATGLDPTQAFVSLVYDVGSVPSGPRACQPTGLLNGQQMLLGFWQVDEDGNGSLFAQKTGDGFAALSEIGTVSVRNANLALQACGAVEEIENVRFRLGVQQLSNRGTVSATQR